MPLWVVPVATMVFVYGSLHKKCLVLWKERYFVLKVRPPNIGRPNVLPGIILGGN